MSISSIRVARELDQIIVVADPRQSSQISARNSLDSNSGLVGPGTGGLALHRTRQARAVCRCRKLQWSAARELLDETLFARFRMSVPSPKGGAATTTPIRGLAVADATSLRRKLARSEHAMG
jgi:hypothetical protein